MNVRATAKFIGTSSRKVGLVAGLIRGRGAREALNLLQQTPKGAATPMGKVLGSAIANAENNYNLNAKDLQVASVLVGPSRTLKRFRPRAKGSAAPIKHRSSHITIILSEQPKTVKPAAASAKTEAKASKPAAKEAK